MVCSHMQLMRIQPVEYHFDPGQKQPRIFCITTLNRPQILRSLVSPQVSDLQLGWILKLEHDFSQYSALYCIYRFDLFLV